MGAVKRSDYVRYFVQQGGLTYVDAERVYTVMMRFFADSLASQHTVHLGRVGLLKPRQMEPRTVTMGFKRSKGKVENLRRQYFIGRRTKYVFRVNRTFAANHGLAAP
jgi:hypothetical protein